MHPAGGHHGGQRAPGRRHHQCDPFIDAYVLSLTGADEDGALTGDLDITDDLTIVGATTGSPSDFRIFGKGDRVFNIHPGVTATIRGVTILSGHADVGGGIRNQGNLTLINSELLNNVADTNGGAIANLAGATLTVQNSGIFDNQASRSGGALFNTGTATLKNVTITSNSTTLACSGACGGGGVHVRGGTVAFQNVTIDHNSTAGAEGGGGIDVFGFQVGAATIRNTIVAQNSATALPNNSNCQGAITSAGHNLEFHPTAGATCSLNAALGDLIGPDPKLGGLKSSGGTQPGTRTRSLLAGSPAIDTAPRTWPDLKTLEVRILDNRDHVIWVRWDEQFDLFSLVDPATGAPGPPGTPGSPTTFETPFATLFLGNTGSTGTGPSGQSVTLTLSLSFKPLAAGRTYTIEVRATDDDGAVQGFDPAGTLTVGGPFDNDKDAHHKPRRLTEEQNQQRQRTDRSSLDDTRNEGNVLATRCDEDPPLAIIANRDGQVTIQLLYEAKKACRSTRAGDYLEASGEKQTEQLFEAHDVTITRGGERVR